MALLALGQAVIIKHARSTARNFPTALIKAKLS
jgi:hypothetical protein